MRVLVCPDKWKGSLTAAEAAAAIGRGIRAAWPDVELDLLPLADGGEGSREILAGAWNLKPRRLTVTGPLRRPVAATYSLGRGRAVIETAAACGLQLVPPTRRNPEDTTTVGVGNLIDDALARGAREVYLLLGGSSTNDCGAGMAAALGYRFFTEANHDIVPMAGSLAAVDRIASDAVSPLLQEARIVALCDVRNPLLGLSGATYMYARQKGASEEALPRLEEGMRHFAGVVERDLGVPVTTREAGGAAGGLGAGCVAFLGAELLPGTDVIFPALSFTERASAADLSFTGEGSLDEQTLQGKVVAATLAAGKPTIAVCGRCTLDGTACGLDAILSLETYSSLPLVTRMARAGELLQQMVTDYCLRHKEYW